MMLGETDSKAAERLETYPDGCKAQMAFCIYKGKTEGDIKRLKIYLREMQSDANITADQRAAILSNVRAALSYLGN